MSFRKRLVVGFCCGMAAGLTCAAANDVFLPQRPQSMFGPRIAASLSATTCSFPPPKPNFTELSKHIYGHLDETYEALGQLELGEEHITVKENVFSQIGVIDVDGIRNMWRSVVIPDVRPLTRPVAPKGSTGGHDDAAVVFCDIGSGVGNVCLQVLAETGCRKALGIEVIPSRHRKAVEAFDCAQSKYPDIFTGKRARFECIDLVDSVPFLTSVGVTVLFTHSWMFDDDVMQKLSAVIAQTPSIQCVISSRPLNEPVLDALSAPPGAAAQPKKRFPVHRLMHFSADWNEHAPFHIYTTHTASGSV